ncbi:MAG: hypothetical protein ACOCVU_00065 [Desulfohalobiaceae bacterium]
MDEKSMQAVAEAFLLQAVFAARSGIFAEKAAQEGNSAAARYFQALAMAQQVQADMALVLLRGKAETTEDNLSQVLEDLEDTASLFKDLAADAKGRAARILDQFGRAGKAQAALVGHVGLGREQAYRVCRACGFIAAGKDSAQCPVCGAAPEKFVLVE